MITHLRHLLAESDMRFKELHAKVETALFIEDHKESIEERRKIIEWINKF